MNLGKIFLGFLGRSLSGPCKLIGESTAFAKKSLDGGFSGKVGGGKFECGIDEGDGIWNATGWIIGIPLSLWGLWK